MSQQKQQETVVSFQDGILRMLSRILYSEYLSGRYRIWTNLNQTQGSLDYPDSQYSINHATLSKLTALSSMHITLHLL